MKTKRRYNAKIQRAKGLFEIAAAMYDTSLSFETRRAALLSRARLPVRLATGTGGDMTLPRA
jgi:hypothetical protein